jgi:uncharacterized protein
MVFPKIRFFYFALSFLFVLGFFASTFEAQETVKTSDAKPQQWVGGVKIGEDWMSVRLQVEVKGNRAAGLVSIRQLGIVRQSIQTRIVSGQALRIVVSSSGSDSLSINGTILNDRINGTLQKGNRRGKFQVFLIGNADEQSLARFAGEYRFSPDRLLYILPQNDALHYVDLKNGNRGWLFQSSKNDTEFIEILPLGAATLAPKPRLTVAFERGENGNIKGLRWGEIGQKPINAALELIRREEINYASAGNISIAGTLYFPKGAPPFPAVILRGGAGATNRTNFDWMARFFVEQGYAVLTTDKRGVGKSTGSYESATYSEYAADVYAGLRFLQNRPDIRRQAIGMWGHSEGAWIVPMAAANAPKDVSFVILSAAIGVPPWQQEIFLTETLLRAEGYGETEIAEALALRGLMFEVIASNGGKWEEFRAGIDKYQKARWLERLIDMTADKQIFLAQNRDLLHDPKPSLSSLRAPVLAVIGECDHIVPAQESRVALAQIFSAADNLDYSIKIIPNMGHGLQDECGDTDRKGLQVRGYSSEYLNVLRQWLRQHAKKI